MTLHIKRQPVSIAAGWVLLFGLLCTRNSGVSSYGLVPTVSAPFTHSTCTKGRGGLFGKRHLPLLKDNKRSLFKVTASSSQDNDRDDASSSKQSKALQYKQDLLEALSALKDAQARDGDFSDIDWGAKGGELTETGRVPRQVDYSMISKDVGDAAQNVMEICAKLQEVSPTENPTQYLGDKQQGDKAPLQGAWKLLFSNAADAVFSKDSKRGAARAQNVVNAKKGRITNIIDFEATTDETTGEVKEPTLKQLNIVIKATALSDKRVELNFQYAKVVLTKFFFLPLFGRTLSLYLPVPATFITQVIEFFKTVARFLGIKKKPYDKDEKRTAKGYFDVLYLDHQLRVHKTGQGNLFVQAKDDWQDAKPLIR